MSPVDSGDVIGGRYRLDRKIGQGGIGRIWLAEDQRLDRRVAIKFLLAQTPFQRARFARRVALEAKIAASIQHRNVVQIFDFGAHDDDTPYIVMEALTGLSLGEALDAGQRFSLDALVHIISEVLRGLAAVHDAGIVHRDLKPENIFLVKEPLGKLSPKLLDFGISRSLEPETRRSAVTTTEGMIVGTPEYMSPEQATGEGDIDKRTDIYSLGVIMFEVLAGNIPFPADNVAELLIAVIQRDAPPLFERTPQIGPALCGVVDKALRKEREQRYAHAAEMHDAWLAAAQRVPAELDRHAALFPTEVNRGRARLPPGDLGEDAAPQARASVHATPSTVRLPSRPPRKSVPRGSHAFANGDTDPALDSGRASATSPAAALPAPGKPSSRYALALGLVAMLSVSAVVAAVFALRARDVGPEETGMIVVQAPAPVAPAPVPSVVSGAPTVVRAVPVESDPVAGALAKDPIEKPARKSRRKPTASQETTPDIATRVADAFSTQKARVIDCLSEHPGDIEGTPQLTVRVSIDGDGAIRQSELLPAAVSSKPVGGCVRAAVARMRFPKPDQLTTFRIPLVWRRK